MNFELINDLQKIKKMYQVATTLIKNMSSIEHVGCSEDGLVKIYVSGDYKFKKVEISQEFETIKNHEKFEELLLETIKPFENEIKKSYHSLVKPKEQKFSSILTDENITNDLRTFEHNIKQQTDKFNETNEITVSLSSPEGLIKAVLNIKGELLDLEISPVAINPANPDSVSTSDIEFVCSKIKEAFDNIYVQSFEAIKEQIITLNETFSEK